MKRLPAFGKVILHRPGIEIEHGFRIKRVAVRTHAGIFKRQVPKMDELAEGAPLGEESEIHVGLGAIEIVGRDRNGVLRLRNGWRGKRQRAQYERELHTPSFSQFTGRASGNFHLPSRIASRGR